MGVSFFWITLPPPPQKRKNKQSVLLFLQLLKNSFHFALLVSEGIHHCWDLLSSFPGGEEANGSEKTSHPCGPHGCGSKRGTQYGLPWEVDKETNTCGPILGGLILTHAHCGPPHRFGRPSACVAERRAQRPCPCWDPEWRLHRWYPSRSPS